MASARHRYGGTGTGLLSLIFAEGTRPDAGAILALSQQDEADVGVFAVPSAPQQSADSIELLVNGLAFDCCGLNPGPSAPLPERGSLIGLSAEPTGCEAIELLPGPHLADAAAMLPVLRAQIGLGARLAELPGVVAICWEPAGTWMEPGYFRKIAEGWLAGGAFPALGLVAHDVSASGVLRTSGLQFLIGQELQLDGRGSLDRAGLARIALRLVHELVLAGPVRADSELVGPEGQQLLLHPRAGSAIIEATIAG